MKTIGYIFVCLLALFLSFSIGRRSVENVKIEIIKTDTIMTTVVKVEIDTHYVDKPVPYKAKDTIYLPNPQNPQNPQFPQPEEYLVYQTKIYQDSTYKAQISGFDAHLDWIETYNRTITKEITVREQIQVKPKKWSLYAFGEAEISAVPDCKLGLGASFTQNRLTIGLDAGKELIRNENFVRINAKFAFARF